MKFDAVSQRGSEASLFFNLITSKVAFLNNAGRMDLPGANKSSNSFKEPESVCEVPIIFVDVKSFWEKAPPALVPRINYRFEDRFLARHLSNFTDAKQLLQVILDTIKAHRAAFNLCGHLHRDISDNNIMISDVGWGILNDWDIARVDVPGQKPTATAPGASHSYRMGTWYFMSGALLKEPTKSPTLQDDLESFHVILYYSLQYLPHNKNLDNVRRIIPEMFEQCENRPFVGLYVGGSGKRDWLKHRQILGILTLEDNVHLTTWIHSALDALHDFYSDAMLPRRDFWAVNLGFELFPAVFPFDMEFDKLVSHYYFLQLGATALSAPDVEWPDNRRDRMLVDRM